ncbi:uncharacterized protein AB9X84_014896 isoform 2-T2 [Acanthopagrus schlegelii]
MTGSTCKLNTSRPSDAVYWCESGSGEFSNSVNITVQKAQSVLTVSPSWLSAGASVTLNCRVKDQSAGWRFYWYKTVPDPSDNFYSYELLPGSSSGTEQDSYIVDGQTHTAGYVCRAGRGDPVFYTDYSQPQFVWSADFHSSASLTVSPDRAQHFTHFSVSLSCEGNSAEWRVRRSPENRYLSDCSTWRTMTGSTCKLKITSFSDAVYWCESGSGEFSNAVNMTILIIQSDTRWELNISAVSKSDEGFYKCQHSRQESAQSWMSVQVSRLKSFSFAVPLIVGLVSGVVLVIPLLVLLCYRASDDSCFVRPVQSESANRDCVDCQSDNYSALLHGDVCVYETIRGPQEAEHDDEPEESSVYMNVQMRSATGQ